MNRTWRPFGDGCRCHVYPAPNPPGNNPKFTPIMPPETYMEAIANAKKIIAPLWATQA